MRYPDSPKLALSAQPRANVQPYYGCFGESENNVSDITYRFTATDGSSINMELVNGGCLPVVPNERTIKLPDSRSLETALQRTRALIMPDPSIDVIEPGMRVLLVVDRYKQAICRIVGYESDKSYIVMIGGDERYPAYDPARVTRIVEELEGLSKPPTFAAAPAPAEVEAPRARKESLRYYYPYEERKRIVAECRAGVKSGAITNLHAWAKAHYFISGKTLRKYLKEFPE